MVASCSDFLDFSWKFVGKDRVTHVNSSNAHYAEFTFKSTSDKTIRINFVRLTTADGKIVKKDEYVDFYIKPFGKDSDLLYGMKSLNLDVVTSGGYSCRFENQPAKKTSTTNSNKSNNTEESPALVLLVVFAIIGFIIYKLVGSKNNPDSNFTSKSQPASSKYQVSPNKNLQKNTVKILSVKEFNKKIKNYIPSHQVASLPRIGDVEGREFQCGCGKSHIMNFNQHYFIADGGIYKAVFLSPACGYLNALKLKGPMTTGIKNLCSTKYLANKPKYGFNDYPDIAGSIDKYFK